MYVFTIFNFLRYDILGKYNDYVPTHIFTNPPYFT